MRRTPKFERPPIGEGRPSLPPNICLGYALADPGECEACALLGELWDGVAERTGRRYCALTELFVRLHDGKDHCDVERG